MSWNRKNCLKSRSISNFPINALKLYHKHGLCGDRPSRAAARLKHRAEEWLKDHRGLVRPLAALYDRPLIWLLPFYCLGLCRAWLSGGETANAALAVSALASLAVVAARLPRRRGCPSYAAVLMIPAVAALGWGLTARSLTPPSNPDHIINYVEPDGSTRAVILGGYVREGSGGRPERNYRLILDVREIIRPGPEGPLETIMVKGRARIGVGGVLTVSAGDYVRLPVTPRRLTGFKNPDGPDFERSWAAQGIWVGGFVKSPALVTSWPEADRAGLISSLRSRAEEFIHLQAPEPAAGFLAAQLIGRRDAVGEAGEGTYRALGLSHILSVSGLHLGVWYGLCFWLSRLFLRRLSFFRRRGANAASAALALVPALLYAALAGGASPVIRAAVMITAAVLAIVALRRSDPWNVLAAAAWVLLLAEPHRLFTASFQLSFVATAAMLAVFTRRPGAETERPRPVTGVWKRPVNAALLRELARKLTTKKQDGTARSEPSGPMPDYALQSTSFFRQSLLAALAGTLGTAPLVVWHFGRLSLAGIPANLIFTPLLSFFVLIPGLMSLAILPFSPQLAAWPMAWASTIQMGLLPLLDELALTSGPGRLMPAPGPVFMIAWYLAGWIWLRGPWTLKKRLATAGLILIVGFLPSWLTGPGHRGVLRFTALDVGQGTAIHLSLPDGRQMLVDGGGGYNFDPGESLITRYLLHQGLSRLDIVALTHPDQDHLKGLVTISRNFRPREVWASPWPENYSRLYQDFLAATDGSRRSDPADFDFGRVFGPAEIKILWPPAGYQWPDQPLGDNWSNDQSLVMKINLGQAAFLITGDIGPGVERRLAELYGAQLRSAVLMAPHHGGHQSLTPEFMAAVQPQWVIFSSGRNNSYGLPHPEALDRARKAGAEIWRTDLSGAAVFEASTNNTNGPSLISRPERRPGPEPGS